LPGRGVTLLEASAGTGKTFTIAALVTRLVAEQDVQLSEILAVTFTRMATGELRERVRNHLVSAEEGLRRLLDRSELSGEARLGGATPAGDDVLALLAKGTAAELCERQRRLARALAGFDAATITTTHGFCQLVLASLGVCGEVAEGATLLEDPRDLVEEVVNDLFVWRALGWGELPLRRKEALRIGLAVAANPGTPLGPAPGTTPSGRRRRLADLVRSEVSRRLLDANLLTYDEVLVRLKETLSEGPRCEAACTRLRERYKVVLVDEFQDTDPVQWEIVRNAFGTGATTLVLIGDPKQAVYAFRGADVHAYLRAARLADEAGGRRFTLGENWRSDQALLSAYDAVFNPLNFGHAEIPYREVMASAAHREPGLEGAPVPQALRARVVHSQDHRTLRGNLTAQGDIRKPEAVKWVAKDLAADVVSLLRSTACLVTWQPGTVEPHRRKVRPGDVAVLVRTNDQARTVHRALHSLGVPAVLAGTDSVFSGEQRAPSPAAAAWLRLLEALEQPASRPRAVAVALTPFVGMSADEVAAAGEETWEGLHSRLHRWAATLRQHGTAALFRTISAEGLTPRVLAGQDGERELTDLGQVAELLHLEGTSGQASPSALHAWLARRSEEAGDDGAEAEERSRRLESDAEAVQVLTVHRAKGLEFPIVYCPYLWDAGWQATRGGPVVYHDHDDGERMLDVGGPEGEQYEQHYQAQCAEERGEDIRQLYVALTRAKHQAVIWWARAWRCESSPLGRLLMFREADGSVPPSGRYTPKDSDVHARLMELASRAPGCISVERCGTANQERYAGPGPGEAVPLRAAAFERCVDLTWRRTSYSGVTSGVHEAVAGAHELVGSEPEEPGTTDEPVTGQAIGPLLASAVQPIEQVSGPSAWLRDVTCPMGDVTRGRDLGTFVHRVLQRVDFAAGDLAHELAVAIDAERAFRPMGPEQTGALVEGLDAAIRTPLGQMAYGTSLRDIARQDRLDELGFELPLAGGESPTSQVPIDEVARLFARHVEPGSRLAAYSARLVDPMLATGLRGYLTGSLDMVFRSQRNGAGDKTRFFVVDYKTNWLGDDRGPLSAWHYRQDALEEEMCRAHYPLQALFYLVALHRYLRWRLPGYEPERNLGGALYLFVRGMLGPGTPVVDGHPCGVFAWQPPIALVSELSDLFDLGATADQGDRSEASHPDGRHR
jgi:exodeoxyribonuclease V beta subunit